MATPALADRVHGLLNAKKPALAARFKSGFKGKGKTDEDQLKDLNDYLRIELGKIEMNTMQERSVLRNDLAPAMWLTYFEKFVLPTMVRFDCPVE